MNEAALVIGALLIACVLYGVFLLGRIDGKADNATEIKKSWNKTVSAECKYNSIKQELITINSVRHNLNCLVGDLKAENERLDGLLHDQDVRVLELRGQVDYEVSVGTGLLADNKLLKADALAFNSLKGKWVTDNKHLVEYHSRKECFRCIGYPEERL